MRTTLNLDQDVIEAARKLATKRKRPLKTMVNEALRRGLQLLEKPTPVKPYHTRARKLGLKPGFSLDNVQELLSQIEGEGRR
jgi:hypothetical protein